MTKIIIAIIGLVAINTFVLYCMVAGSMVDKETEDIEQENEIRKYVENREK